MRDPTTFIKLDRNLLKWRWLGDPNTLAVWIYLLLSANIEARDIRTTTIERGEVYASYDQIASALGLSKKNVRTAIEHLISTGEITKKRHDLKTPIYIIEGFSRYQDKPALDRHEGGTEAAPYRHDAGTDPARPKEYKNKKNDKNDKNGKNARAREAQEPEAKFNPFEFLDQMIAEEEAKEKAKHEQAGNNASDQVSVGILSHDADEDVERSGRDNG